MSERTYPKSRRQPAALYRVRQVVRAALAELAPAPRSVPSPVIAACSGGPDSTVLVDALVSVGVRVVVVAVDHGLRAEARSEAEGVVAYWRGRGVEAVARSVTVERPTQEGARQARYAALLDEAERWGADTIAVGHTASDQLETVLDRLLRGSGLHGLAGMRAQRPLGSVRLWRPLLALPHADIEAYLRALADTPGSPRVVRDPSNTHPRYRRSRVRHTIVPLLEAERPDLARATDELCRRLRDDDDALDFASERALAEVRASDGTLDLAALALWPRGLRVRVLMRACPVPLSSLQVAALERLAAAGAGSAELHLPRHTVAERRYQRLRFTPRAPFAPSAPVTEAAPQAIPGAGSYRFGPTIVEIDGPTFAALGRALGDAPLVLRTLRPGDRTVTGRRLARLLGDRKIPRAQRHRLPIIAGAQPPSPVLWMATIFGIGPRWLSEGEA